MVFFSYQAFTRMLFDPLKSVNTPDTGLTVTCFIVFCVAESAEQIVETADLTLQASGEQS